MPLLAALFQNAVVIFLVLLHQPFQADEAPHGKALFLQKQRGEQTGDTPIAIAERMDAQKIEDKGGGGPSLRHEPGIPR